VQGHPKSFDLLKILAKPLKIWIKSLQIQAKWHPALFDFKIWHPTSAEKHN